MRWKRSRLVSRSSLKNLTLFPEEASCLWEIPLPWTTVQWGRPSGLRCNQPRCVSCVPDMWVRSPSDGPSPRSLCLWLWGRLQARRTQLSLRHQTEGEHSRLLCFSWQCFGTVGPIATATRIFLNLLCGLTHLLFSLHPSLPPVPPGLDHHFFQIQTVRSSQRKRGAAA
jgi:hypothetical protein